MPGIPSLFSPKCLQESTSLRIAPQNNAQVIAIRSASSLRRIPSRQFLASSDKAYTAKVTLSASSHCKVQKNFSSSQSQDCAPLGSCPHLKRGEFRFSNRSSFLRASLIDSARSCAMAVISQLIASVITTLSSLAIMSCRHN